MGRENPLIKKFELVEDQKETVTFSSWQERLSQTNSVELYGELIRNAPFLKAPVEVASFFKKILGTIRGEIESPLPESGYGMTDGEGGEVTYEFFVLEKMVWALGDVVRSTKELPIQVRVSAENLSMLFIERCLLLFKNNEAAAEKVWGETRKIALEEYKNIMREEDNVSLVVEDSRRQHSPFHDYDQDSFWHYEQLSGEIVGEEIKLLKDLIKNAATARIKLPQPLLFDAFRTCYYGDITQELLQYFKTVDTAEVVRNLSKLIRDPQETEANKGKFTRLLYCLEPQMVFIVNNEVEYLGETYRLVGMPPEAVTAKRIAGDGTMGVLGNDGQLLGSFVVADTKKVAAVSEAKVLPIANSQLFAGLHPSSELRTDFLTHYTQFNEELFVPVPGGARLEDLTLHEQLWLYQFVKENTAHQTAARHIGEEFGVAGLRTFISLEHDDRAGENVVTLSRDVDQSMAQAIFIKYSEIVDAAEQAAGRLTKQFKHPDPEGVDTRRIVNALLRSAKDFLITSAKALEKTNETKKLDFSSQLENLRADVLLFAHVFKVAAEKQSLDFNDIEGVSLQGLETKDLTSGEKEVMTAIFVANRHDNPAYSSTWLKNLTQDFGQKLQNPGCRFFLLKEHGQLVAFMHMEKIGEHRYHVGSLNVDPAVRGKTIGSALVRSVLELAGKENILEAVVNVANPMLERYIKDFSFRIVETISDYKGSGQEYVVIERLPGDPQLA